jgi:antirestriction protein ArdC
MCPAFCLRGALTSGIHPNKPYHGINVLVLACQSFYCPYWLTYKQTQDKGGNVRRGEKGTPVVFWNWIEVEDSETGAEKSIPFMRYYMVFNLEQTEGIEQDIIDNSAAYIQSWLRELKNDKSMVILAAGQAQKAVDFIMNRIAIATMDMAV